MTFFDKIFGEIEKYDGFHIVKICVDKGKPSEHWKVVKAVRKSQMIDFLNNRFTASSKYDYYLTANSFQSTGITSSLLAYNNIVIDIDAHDLRGIPPNYKELLWRIQNDAAIIPTAIVYTGRGVQLWYHIECASFKCYKLYSIVRDALEQQISDIIDDNNDLCMFNIDYGASNKDTGLFRLPYSTNTATGTKVQSIVFDTEYSLINLQEKLIENGYIDAEDTSRAKNKPIKYIDCNYLALNRGRLNVLRELAKRQQQEGHRHNIIWLASVSAVQLYDYSDAAAQVRAINEMFFKPIPDRKVISILNNVSKNDFHKVSQNEFFSRLNINESFYRKHSNKKRKEREIKASQKQFRREKVKSDIISGMKQREIADKHCIGIATVKRIAKELREENETKKVSKLP